jgi:hypothetical protein
MSTEPGSENLNPDSLIKRSRITGGGEEGSRALINSRIEKNRSTGVGEEGSQALINSRIKRS